MFFITEYPYLMFTFGAENFLDKKNNLQISNLAFFWFFVGKMTDNCMGSEYPLTPPLEMTFQIEQNERFLQRRQDLKILN